MGDAGSGGQYVPQPTPLPAASIGLEQRTAATGSRDRPNLQTRQETPDFPELDGRRVVVAAGQEPSSEGSASVSSRAGVKVAWLYNNRKKRNPVDPILISHQCNSDDFSGVTPVQNEDVFLAILIWYWGEIRVNVKTKGAYCSRELAKLERVMDKLQFLQLGS
ncbi:hypothetical protein UY3_14297 [Chelonia mydas]|uniref:Uncharacterized protein n=1 Tax=Chelonia mydas TaxID=8469 RepID=M7B8X1_CHEMY|nr:hypothetical protein UY3_14297 [Chelonia mydas]